MPDLLPASSSAMLKYAYAPAEDCTLELRSCDVFREGLICDVLVISAWDDYYEPVEGTMIAALSRYGITVKELKENELALDFRGCDSIKAWVSNELDTPDLRIAWPEGSTTRFRRLAVIESPRVENTPIKDASGVERIPVFERMFRLLALLPLHGVPCRSVATPLLNAGQQKARLQQLTPGLLQGIRMGFDHVPELKQLVIFDLKESAIDELKTTILEHFGNNEAPSELTLTKEQKIYTNEITQRLEKFKKRVGVSETAKTITQDILAQLSDEQDRVNLVAIGVSARKLVESLVRDHTKHLEAETSLFRRINFLDRSISPWTINAMHTVRIFGNWMSHADYQHYDERDKRPLNVNHHHLNAMLLALHCVVTETWKKKERQAPVRLSRAVGEERANPRRAGKASDGAAAARLR